MAKKFIDADMLKEEIEQNWDMQDLYLPIHFFDKVDDMPAAEVEPVKCGRWIKIQYYALCSLCRHEVNWLSNDFLSPYCPNCGARMDGDNNDTQ